jgi:hypothetical protein
MMAGVQLPHTLVAAVKEGKAVLFLGAGASFGATHPSGRPIPDAASLRDAICDQFLNGSLKDRSLIQVTDFASNETSLIIVQEFIRKEFIEYRPADFHKLIAGFQWHAIVTTNLDLIIEQAYDDNTDRVQTLIPFVKNGQPIETRLKAAHNGIQYLKLHGCISRADDTDIPFTLGTEQYVVYNSNRDRLFARVSDYGAEFPFVFCGYSISDPHIQKLIFNLFENEALRPMYYYVAPQLSEYEQRYWSAHRITPMNMTFEALLQQLDQAISPVARTLIATLGGGAISTRKHYRVSQPQESDNLRVFLAQDFEHVHGDMPIATSSPREFFKGYDHGWAAIEASWDVRRRVEDGILADAILVEEEDRAHIADLFVIKGPAGNGKTVILKRVAWEASNEFDKLVLFQRTGGACRFDALQELYQLTGKRTYLFIDKAAYSPDDLLCLITSARKEKIPITTVVAERDNEWNVRCEALDPLVSQDYLARYFSESEIRDLLERLDRHKALGILEPMTHGQRIDAFVYRAQRQILVALHEATQGKPFEEIVYDEYQRIIPKEAQSVYLDVCTLDRLGAPVRAGLISRISGIGFEDFKSRFLQPLECIVDAE